MTDQPPPPATPRFLIVFVVLLTLFGLGLRFYRLSNQSFWTDEIYSLIAARTPLDHIVAMSEFPNNSTPTYFLILREVVGQSNEAIEFRARFISVLAGAFSIPLFMAIVYRWRRRIDVSLAAGLLLTVNPLDIWYSQEARAYASTLLFGLLTLLFFDVAVQRKRAGWWIAYFLAAVFGTALHKTGVIFPAICSLWHAWSLLRQPKRWPILMIHAAILFLAVTVLSPKPPNIGPESQRPMTGLELPYTMLTYVGGYSFGPSLSEIQLLGPKAAVSRNKVEISIMLGVLLLLAIAIASNLDLLPSSRGAALCVLNLAIVTGYSLVHQYPYNIRYTLPALLGFIALAADLMIRANRSYLARPALAALLIVSLWADYQWYYSPAYRKEDSRAVAQWLIDNRDHINSGLLDPGYSKTSVEWYLDSLGHPEVASRLHGAAVTETISFPPVPDILIMGRRDHIVQPGDVIGSYLAAAGNARKIQSFSGFEIFARNPIP